MPKPNHADSHDRFVDLSIRATAKELGITTKTVGKLIRRGELQAYVVSLNPNAKRPTYRVRYASILAFKERRDALKQDVFLHIFQDL